MYRIVIIACITIVVALMATIGLKQGEQGATFTFNNGLEVHSLDPHRISWKHDIRIANALFEGLMAFKILPPEAGELQGRITVVPGVAERVDVSDDGTIYTFYMRDDACWSNGEAVTADHFRWSWQRVMTPATAADYAGMMFVIRGARAYYDALAGGGDASFDEVGIRVVDERTLQVTLESPTAYFLELTAFVPFMPVYPPLLESMPRRGQAEINYNGVRVYDEGWTRPGVMVSNGPFVLKEHRFKRDMVLEKNPLYWDRENVSLERIRALAIEDTNAALYAYESGQCDLIESVPASTARRLAEQESSLRRKDYYRITSFGTYFYRFNCQEEARGQRNPFADARVRRAFALTVDREDIVANVTGLRQLPAGTLIPPGLTVLDASGAEVAYHGPAGLEFDPPAARALLAEAGYADPAAMGEVQLMFNTGYGHQPIAERLAATWRRELGADIVLNRKDGSAFGQALKRRDAKEWHLGRSTWFGDYRDPSTFLEMLLTGDGNNDCGYSSNEFDRLMAEAAGTADQRRRMELFAEAERLAIVEEAAIVPIFFFVEQFMIRPHVHGAWPNMMGMILLKQISVD